MSPHRHPDRPYGRADEPSWAADRKVPDGGSGPRDVGGPPAADSHDPADPATATALIPPTATDVTGTASPTPGPAWIGAPGPADGNDPLPRLTGSSLPAAGGTRGGRSPRRRPEPARVALRCALAAVFLVPLAVLALPDRRDHPAPPDGTLVSTRETDLVALLLPVPDDAVVLRPAGPVDARAPQIAGSPGDVGHWATGAPPGPVADLLPGPDPVPDPHATDDGAPGDRATGDASAPANTGPETNGPETNGPAANGTAANDPKTNGTAANETGTGGTTAAPPAAADAKSATGGDVSTTAAAPTTANSPMATSPAATSLTSSPTPSPASADPSAADAAEVTWRNPDGVAVSVRITRFRGSERAPAVWLRADLGERHGDRGPYEETPVPGTSTGLVRVWPGPDPDTAPGAPPYHADASFVHGELYVRLLVAAPAPPDAQAVVELAARQAARL